MFIQQNPIRQKLPQLAQNVLFNLKKLLLRLNWRLLEKVL